ncbi:MAG TPA: hypothetical protein PLT64_09240 [Syntrophales bacterium]|nr:hypothetical protein [Syntrophales bacterium]HOL60026.1 hypothetical protein [Syntrophales bacterium]
MSRTKEHLCDLMRDYLALTRALRSAAQGDKTERLLALIKDREELKENIAQLRRSIRIGKKEASVLLALMVEMEEIEREIAPILERIFAREKSLLFGLKGYGLITPRTHLVDTST